MTDFCMKSGEVENSKRLKQQSKNHINFVLAGNEKRFETIL